jgi:hypothetical protein
MLSAKLTSLFFNFKIIQHNSVANMLSRIPTDDFGISFSLKTYLIKEKYEKLYHADKLVFKSRPLHPFIYSTERNLVFR